jgi:hypothetical protein
MELDTSFKDVPEMGNQGGTAVLPSLAKKLLETDFFCSKISDMMRKAFVERSETSLNLFQDSSSHSREILHFVQDKHNYG